MLFLDAKDGDQLMGIPLCSDDEFIRLWAENPSPQQMANILKIATRNVYQRRRSLEAKYNIKLDVGVTFSHAIHPELDKHDAAKYIEVENGTVIIGSDAHYWPGIVTAAHKAFVHFIKELQPKAVILNGDVLDGATISRFPPIGWTDSDKPSLVQEMNACQQRLTEIEDSCTKSAHKIWTLGNHDGRFESKLAIAAPQYVKVHGVHLKDHFPSWRPAWACWVNDNVVVKHRWKGGIHATHNNTVNSGKTMVTGHLHSLKVTPFSDYNGTRFGVDTGTLADCYGPQTVDYTELNPVNWRSGFAVLTFHKGKLLWPELVHVLNKSEVEFRGKVYVF